MWTLAQICLECEAQLSKPQKEKAKTVIKNFMKSSNNWIVQNACVQTLGAWAAEDKSLRQWLLRALKPCQKTKEKPSPKKQTSI